MFRKKRGTLNADLTETVIGEGTLIEGKVVLKAGLRVEGRVTGDIECAGDVTVGKTAVLHSNVTARDVRIAGTVHGNVSSGRKLLITPTGQLFGSIDVQTVTIMEGGIFQGTSRMEPRALPADALHSKREQKRSKPAKESKAANG
jgi:cytoskeletal protein CcmA (bactofilin family)